MDITAEIIAYFREYFPEFEDTTKWPEKWIIQALEEGDSETGRRWLKYEALSASLKKRGMFNFAAHQLIMKQRRIQGDVGVAYAVSSKSVADESISYAVPAANISDMVVHGDLDLTHYGLEFLRLRRRAGSGGLMI